MESSEIKFQEMLKGVSTPFNMFLKETGGAMFLHQDEHRPQEDPFHS